MHDGWAQYYDFVYDECFGAAFWRLTAETLDVIAGVRRTPARVIDLGAGTGRIAIPLALLGYEVTAVERSAGMADVLACRAANLGVTIDLRRSDFLTLASETDSAGPPPEPFDLALATFTVLNYLVSDDDVARLARVVAARLRSGAHFVFDLAARRLFAPALFESKHLHREITVRQIAPAVFEYRDAGSGTANGQRFHYDEIFTLRYWGEEEVLALFARAGLVLEKELTHRLRESGSRWFVLTRQ